MCTYVCIYLFSLFFFRCRHHSSRMRSNSYLTVAPLPALLRYEYSARMNYDHYMWNKERRLCFPPKTDPLDARTVLRAPVMDSKLVDVVCERSTDTHTGFLSGRLTPSWGQQAFPIALGILSRPAVEGWTSLEDKIFVRQLMMMISVTHLTSARAHGPLFSTISEKCYSSPTSRGE